MVRKPNYCKGIIIAHGKSELLLAEHIKSNLHLPIEIYAESNGKTSIQIDSLMTVLGNNIFKNKRVFNQKYVVEEEKGILKNFSLMPIMDLDDTSEDRKQKYISYLTNIYTLKEYRSKKIGTELLTYIKDYLAKEDCELVFAWPSSKSVNWYLRNDFKLENEMFECSL